MDISAVIVTYNSAKFLNNNLDSLQNQTVKFKNIFVVDNNSTDGSLEIIDKFETVSKIVLEDNCGYAAAANTGIRACSSDLILVANSDIVLDKFFNESVLNKFLLDPDVVILSPLILRFDKRTVDSAGQVKSRSLYPREIGFGQDVHKLELKETDIFSSCGAATVFSRKGLEKLAINDEYYDSDYFMFWEDFDIGWRANLFGLKSVFFPGAVVFHFRSGTLKKGFVARFSLALARNSEIKFHLVKNRYLTLIKNFRLKKNYLSIPFILFKDLIWVTLLTISSPKNIIKLLGSGRYFKSAFRKRKLIKKHE